MCHEQERECPRGWEVGGKELYFVAGLVGCPWAQYPRCHSGRRGVLVEIACTVQPVEPSHPATKTEHSGELSEVRDGVLRRDRGRTRRKSPGLARRRRSTWAFRTRLLRAIHAVVMGVGVLKSDGGFRCPPKQVDVSEPCVADVAGLRPGVTNLSSGSLSWGRARARSRSSWARRPRPPSLPSGLALPTVQRGGLHPVSLVGLLGRAVDALRLRSYPTYARCALTLHCVTASSSHCTLAVARSAGCRGRTL